MSKIKPSQWACVIQTAFIGDWKCDFSDWHQASPFYKPIVSLCVNYLLKITSKIKPRPVGLSYTSSIYRQSGMSLYWLTLSFSAVKQLDWPELMLSIKAMCKIKLRLWACVIWTVLNIDREHHFTDQNQVGPSLNRSIGLNLCYPKNYLGLNMWTSCYWGHIRSSSGQ